MTLNYDPLTLKLCGTSSIRWSKSIRNLSDFEQSADELLTILQIFAHIVTLWP